MKVVRSASRTERLYPQEMFLVLIFTRNWVEPMASVRLEGICHRKNSPLDMKASFVDISVSKLMFLEIPGAVEFIGLERPGLVKS